MLILIVFFLLSFLPSFVLTILSCKPLTYMVGTPWLFSQKKKKKILIRKTYLVYQGKIITICFVLFFLLGNNLFQFTGVPLLIFGDNTRSFIHPCTTLGGFQQDMESLKHGHAAGWNLQVSDMVGHYMHLTCLRYVFLRIQIKVINFG
jgi:hypothetical protein